MKRTLLSLALALALPLSAAAYETSAPGRDNPVAAGTDCTAAVVSDGSLWTEGWETAAPAAETAPSGEDGLPEDPPETPENPEERADPCPEGERNGEEG